MAETFDSKELIKKFHGFFKEYHTKDIRKALSSEKDYVEVDFFEISEYDLEFFCNEKLYKCIGFNVLLEIIGKFLKQKFLVV